MTDSNAKSVRVTLVKSTSGQLKRHQASVRGLGLKRIRDTRVVGDTPEIRGMIRSARHLLKVENA
ncbi:MAG TPA: 50S ribosomal protein L30 [Steroidobacteraceae bacterium]|nr:50S ribosomal protein L30 [Steroidobacteraceae bacterium]